MEILAFELTRIVRAFRIPAFVGFDPLSRQYVYRETPTSILYPVSLESGQKFDSLLRAIPDIERELNQKLRRSDIRLFVQRSPSVIEVLKPSIVQVPLTKSVLRLLKPFIGVLGERYTILSNEIVGINLQFPETAHILISGMTGSGKSSVLKTFLTSICYSTSPNDLRLFAIDMKNRGLKFLSEIPHLEAPIGILEEDAIQIVERVSFLLQKRRLDSEEKSLPRIILAIDELAEFTSGRLAETLFSTLPTIARQGRELGIHLVVTIHRPTVSGFGGDFLQSFGAKVTGRLRNAKEANLIMGIPDSGAERLGRPGQMIYYRGTGDPLRFQAYLPIAPEGHILLKWGKSSQPMLPELPSQVPSKEEETVSKDLEVLREIIKEYVVFKEGTKFSVRRGGWSRMAEALGTAPGGSTTTRCINAILAYQKENDEP